METKIILELIDIMDKADLTALRVDDGSLKVELERTRPGLSQDALPLVAGALQGAPAAPAAAAKAAASPVDERQFIVRSPMVGTFYVAPSPDEPPFVQVGQGIQAGQTLCIVEAMKMMNEIIAEKSGTIAEVLAANATQVEYDQPLFIIDVA
ncbi:MAG: acetyl-CoA carboxylase biotin carboxyl carrier protein [Coriobacteriales bacterium]|nr:acetyl-CoA carboxylase biotin carboxyl carrier protein [Coriobacteriales bacterium]MBQ6585268.1 acetyl-CoA carboxylase biotin carboxyl carrier protein [Coriobacteriales bacterium]